MKKALLVTAATLLSCAAQASHQPNLQCRSLTGTGTSFHMSSRTLRGVLRLEGRPIAMVCRQAEPSNVVGYDVPIPLFECRENRSGEGLFLVSVRSGGFTGWTVADVQQQQIFPLDPYYIEMLRCRP